MFYVPLLDLGGQTMFQPAGQEDRIGHVMSVRVDVFFFGEYLLATSFTRRDLYNRRSGRFRFTMFTLFQQDRFDWVCDHFNCPVSIYTSSNVNTASGMRVLVPYAISMYRVRDTKSLTRVLSSVVFALGVCLPESLYIGCCVHTGFGQHNTASRMRVTN